MDNLKGYGFRPSDAELIGYLRDRALLGPDYLVQDITDLGADICKWEPWDLLDSVVATSNDPVRYFTYPITYKHRNNNSKMLNMATDEGPGRKPAINRATNGGNWKVSGERVKVRASDSQEIGIKTHLYFCPSLANKENKKQSKTRDQNSCQKVQNKTTWVQYVYELIDVEPTKNKYFLGKLMLNQSEPTNNSSSKGETSQQLPSNYLENAHIPTSEVQPNFHQEPLVEMEVSHDYDWIQNQSSEQTNEFVNSFLADNYETYPEQRSNHDGNEVISNLKPSNLQNYVADCADVLQDLQVNYSEVSNPEEFYTNQCHHSFGNGFIGNDETDPEERSNKHNTVAEYEGFNLPNNFCNYPISDISQMISFDIDDPYWDGFYPDEFFRLLEASENNGDGVQNQSSVNQQVAAEFRNSNLIDNETACPDERGKSPAAEIEGTNFPSLGMGSFRKRSGTELEGSNIDMETEVAQAQAKKSRI